MILRPHGDGFLLIPQIEHARLSGEMAAVWADHHQLQPAVRDEMVRGIFAHDDGWAEPDANPSVDPALGHPRGFRDHEPEQSIKTWTRSIERAGRHGPLAEWIVAAHFTRLAAPLSGDAIRNWIDETKGRQDELVAAGVDPEAAAFGASLLKLLDLWSILICSGTALDGATLSSTDGSTLTHRLSGHGRLSITPWPFETDELSLAVQGRRWSSGEGFGDPVTLTWKYTEA